MVSYAVPFTFRPKAIVRSPNQDVSLTRDYVPTAGPGVMSLGAGVEVTTRTPGPTGELTNSFPVGVTVVAVPPVGGDGA